MLKRNQQNVPREDIMDSINKVAGITWTRTPDGNNVSPLHLSQLVRMPGCTQDVGEEQDLLVCQGARDLDEVHVSCTT